MADKTALESYLTCTVCSETFRDPVSLSCQHTFCSSCLQKLWKQTKHKNCPICKKKSSKDLLIVNLALKKVADSYAGRETVESCEMGKGDTEVEMVCSKHPEDPKMFCEEEQRVVCNVCESFQLHQDHKLVPLERAVSDLKEQLKSDSESLQDMKKKCKEVETTYKEMVQYSKKQLVATERQIRAEFNKLHQLLKEEEEARLAAVREEEKQKGKIIAREMKTIQEKMTSLSESISAIQKDLQKHTVPFLNSYKPTQTSARAQCSLSDPQPVSGALIDVAKHLGNLSYRVWEKMKGKVKFSPVILDPNTATGCLFLSNDLTGVRHRVTKLKLPDNLERNTQYAEVLGSEGFSSGKHSWEVEVGDHPTWTVGLAKESVDRKGKRHGSPEDGTWCLCHRSGRYSTGISAVTLKKSLRSIRVQLDYERGEVSFYNAEDMTNIYTHQDTFTEKLYPFINIGSPGDAETTDIKVQQVEASLMLQS